MNNENAPIHAWFGLSYALNIWCCRAQYCNQCRLSGRKILLSCLNSWTLIVSIWTLERLIIRF